jgi:hypothetical protein
LPITKLSFDAGTIAYVVRFKASHSEAATEAGGHSDCILSTGAPVGYFGEFAFFSGKGFVSTFSGFAGSRPHYVNIANARATPCISTVLIMQVGPTRAKAFRDAWISMRAKADGFGLVGNNCSTHASRACYAAGVIRSPEVSGTDTPSNLYDQIVGAGLAPWRSISGYLGFAPRSKGTDEMLMDFDVTMDALGIATVGGPSAKMAFR